MTKRPIDPILVDLDQFAGFDDALDRIHQDRPFDDLAHQIRRDFVDRGGEWNDAFVFFSRPHETKKGAVNRKSIRALVNYMDARHTDQFAVVDAELCEMAHFGTLAL